MKTTTLLGDKPINRMGFGAMQLARPGMFGPPADPEGARAVLRRAIDLGVDHIDTSQYYGPDVVNDLIREALYPYPENLRRPWRCQSRISLGRARIATVALWAEQPPRTLARGALISGEAALPRAV
jgi:predicted aldo/keto reductase-like oxidoreductase